MDEAEETLDSSVSQENFFTSPTGDLSSMNITTCRSLNAEENCPSKHGFDSVMDAVDTVIIGDQDSSKQAHSPVKENSNSSPEILDQSVPCSQPSVTLSPSSPTVTLVPVTSQCTPKVKQQEQNPQQREDNVIVNKEITDLSDSSSVDHQIVNYFSGEGRSNYHFAISQDQIYALPDEDSCDASYLQSASSYSANAFNQQYQDKREEDESRTTAEFSPEAFFSSIPLFKTLKKKKPAAILPKLPTDPNITILFHDSNQGVPIAPRPDPNTKLSCYVLVVPAPLYYETIVPQETLLLQQDQPADMSVTVPLEYQEKITEIEATPEAPMLPQVTAAMPDPSPMHPPDWTPKPPKLPRTPLPSTRVRVSPSPHRGSRCSPVITVSTTSTPIQPLQGNTQQYVIVQGNHRHLRGLPSYKDSFYTPTVDQAGHQPIYLQGLPPQGFRRHWKDKENTCAERATKRSLAPLFSKASAPANLEATVPQQTERSPLTCIRSKASCDREVPETESMSPDQSPSTKDNLEVETQSAAAEETSGPDTTGVAESECPDNNEPPLAPENDEHDVITITPITHAKGEDKERKKIRDRKYDAELKKAFEKLRRLVPRMQKSYSRNLILQETIKYIGILENKLLDAGLWSTLQTRDRTEHDTQNQKEQTQELVAVAADSAPSPMTSTVSDICGSLSNTVEETPTMLTGEDGSGNPPDNTAASAVTSPVILSLSTEDGPCLFGSPEGGTIDPDGDIVMLEEIPLSIQFLPIDPSDTSPVLTPQSPDEPLPQDPHPRLIPVVEVPGYTECGEHLGVPNGEHFSPHRDVLLSAVTTISHESLSDLGVTLSPLLSPLGILLSPCGDHGDESTIAVVVESPSSGVEENVAVSASGVIPGACSDMTSIAASVEVTTDPKEKWSSPSTGRARRSPRSRTAQTVPSVSPLQADDSKRSSPRCRNRSVLQDHGNFEDVRSPGVGNGRGRRRKLKDRSPEQSIHHADENSAFAANQSRTPPERVSGVILSGRGKTPSSRRGVDKKRIRRT